MHNGADRVASEINFVMKIKCYLKCYLNNNNFFGQWMCFENSWEMYYFLWSSKEKQNKLHYFIPLSQYVPQLRRHTT